MKTILNLSIVLIIAAGVTSCNQQSQKDQKEESEAITYENDKLSSDKSMKSAVNDIPESDYAFGTLPYKFNDLEPYIDQKTMRLHYNKHHKGYYKKFLNAIENTEAEGKSIIEIFKNITQYSTRVRNNGGGYYNHWVFWHSLTPESGKPGDKIMTAIKEDFGSFDEFKKAFNAAAASQFGSGWAWLIVNDEKKLEVTNTPNQNNPVMNLKEMNGGMPLLALDVWEHAYYLNYKNRRTKYIENFWKLVDWQKVEQRYKKAVNKDQIFTP